MKCKSVSKSAIYNCDNLGRTLITNHYGHVIFKLINAINRFLTTINQLRKLADGSGSNHSLSKGVTTVILGHLQTFLAASANVQTMNLIGGHSNRQHI